MAPCRVYVRRRCRCGHTARQHEDRAGACFAAANVCACPRVVVVDQLAWCDAHHRPAGACERAREADEGARRPPAFGSV